ncbi:hypothetical protein [Pararhodobacter zhoushanensis]|uniref:Poly(3-hydroxyalkanoate) polymerase subunit PhaE n=1 Tax=Pararhodobacter zhoushanensis TaxID=2479545 RepID=A0ABT3GVP8_9RHOB|nr:hypothetical protein [Pararhodobacter zhoushanensis]MCW1931622.1 hypothetical protein [Pararhodobacter zhoushanensis]
MSDDIPPAGTFTPVITFWTQIWQAQVEQSLRLWAAWAQMMPHDSARALAQEAEQMKPAIPRTVAVKPAASATVTAITSAAPRKAPAKAAAKPAAAKPATAPAKKAPRTPVRTRKPAQATKPVLH